MERCTYCRRRLPIPGVSKKLTWEELGPGVALVICPRCGHRYILPYHPTPDLLEVS